MTHKWPTEPLIRIDKGVLRGNDISGTTATLADVDDPEFGYYLLDGPKQGFTICEDVAGESITAARPCAAVPIGELKALRNAFMGVELTNFQHAVIQKLIARTPIRQPATNNDPLGPKMAFGERGDDNRVAVTIDMVPLSSTYDVP